MEDPDRGLKPQVRDFEDTQSAFDVLKEFFFEHDKLMPPVTPEIAAVVEAHRKEIGAQKLHVSLGPEATPEGVREQLKSVERQMAEYHALPETIRLRARILELEDVIRQVGKLGQTDMKKYDDQHPDVTALKSEIFDLTDIIGTDIKVAMDLARKEGIL